MSELPRRLSPRTNLSANWLNRLLDYLRSRDLHAGPGVKLTRTPSGTTISASSALPGAAVSAGDNGCVLASVDSYNYQTGVFEATIWTFTGDGGASGKKVKVICPTMSGITRIASGEVVILHKCQMDEYEGEEVEEEGEG